MNATERRCYKITNRINHSFQCFEKWNSHILCNSEKRYRYFVLDYETTIVWLICFDKFPEISSSELQENKIANQPLVLFLVTFQFAYWSLVSDCILWNENIWKEEILFSQQNDFWSFLSSHRRIDITSRDCTQRLGIIAVVFCGFGVCFWTWASKSNSFIFSRLRLCHCPMKR